VGPCTKPIDRPRHASTRRARGPGGASVFEDRDGRRWLALHAWLEGKVGYPDGARNLFVVPLRFDHGRPVT
jgi:hypothetical protein